MRLGWRWHPLVALVCAAEALVSMNVGTTATMETAVVDRGAADGDAYALVVHGLGSFSPQAPSVGPMAAVQAQTPPTGTTSRQSGTMVCDSSAGAGCPASVLRSLRVTDDSVVATLQPGRRGCEQPADDGALWGGRALAPPAASACDVIAHTEFILDGIGVIADQITSRSAAQGCDHLAGSAGVGELRVAGIPLTRGTGPGGLLPGSHTFVLPPGSSGAGVLATVVLDEQILDPQDGGLTVNAVHLRGGPALGSASGLDVILGHTHTSVRCPTLTLQRETIPGGEVTYALIDPAVFPLDTGVVGNGSPACFAGNLRGNGCMEPIAAMVARRRALLGVTANYTDWIHVLGAAIADHHLWSANDAPTTGLCITDGDEPGQPVVSIVRDVDPRVCRAAVSGQRVVRDGHRDIEGLSDAGHHGRFWWSTRPSTAEPRAMVGVLSDGTVLIALATATRSGVLGGIDQPDMVSWLIDHGVVNAIEMDGGNQGDMVVAGGGHVVPLGDGIPRLQISLLIDTPGSQAGF